MKGGFSSSQIKISYMYIIDCIFSTTFSLHAPLKIKVTASSSVKNQLIYIFVYEHNAPLDSLSIVGMDTKLIPFVWARLEFQWWGFICWTCKHNARYNWLRELAGVCRGKKLVTIITLDFVLKFLDTRSGKHCLSSILITFLYPLKNGILSVKLLK